MPRPPDRPEAGPAAAYPAFLIHGENAFLAREFVAGLKTSLAAPEAGPPSVERYSLEEASWPDILDVARTIPFPFAPWRILVVEAEGRDEDLTDAEAAGLADYLASPTDRTTLVVLLDGKIRKTKALAKTFAAAPASSVQVREFETLKGERLKVWARAKFDTLGRRVSGEALDRLMEIVDNDLGRIGLEIEKLAAYSGDESFIGIEAIDDLAGGIKKAEGWELQATLEDRNAEKAISVLHRIFARDRDKAPLFVLGILAGFFRDLLLARIQDGAAGRTREEIYAELKPQYVRACRTFPSDKCGAFFSLAGRKDLPRFLEALEEIDLRLKTTESSPRPLFEAFVWDFCRGGAARVTSPERGRSFRSGG